MHLLIRIADAGFILKDLSPAAPSPAATSPAAPAAMTLAVVLLVMVFLAMRHPKVPRHTPHSFQPNGATKTKNRLIGNQAALALAAAPPI